ncbi:MAG: hypothetical protein J6X18_04195 [Bacteroidales bacterium]|nr:hypothetical protein [Bacteroidales bacterium]
MSKYRFVVKYGDGRKENHEYDEYQVAMRKQADFVKKAKRNNNIDEVSGVKPIEESKQVVRLNESDFRRIVSEAVKNFLKESKKRQLNEEAIGNGTDFEAVNKWVFWCFNWEPIENYAHIFKGAPKEHFIDKFNGCRGDMNRFYAELDSTNRPILVDYVMNNFRG